MTTLKSLTQSAMLGSTDDALLALAVRTGIAELGGYIPATFEGKSKACDAETRPQMPAKASGLLKRTLAGELDVLLPEILQLTAEHGYLVPPETLPSLLGLSKNAFQRLALPVIGERGRWLASHNPAWAYALGRDPLDAWENGSRAERVRALEQIRLAQPGQAREWVQASWEQDAPEDRAAFLGAFAIGLSMEDEPFLESCLDNKRKEVREAARGLLLRLENSRFVGRMWARVKSLVRMKSKFSGDETLEVTLPEGLDSAAQRDGLSGAWRRKKMGEKANVLAQMLALTPPVLWNREFNRPPEKLIAAALNCEWREPLLLGWQSAAIGAADVAWAEALVSLWVTKVERQSILDVDSLTELITLMRAEKVEALTTSIKPILNELNDESPLVSLLEKYRRPWTAKMARTVVQSAQRQSGDFCRRLPPALPHFAQWMPPELADEFSQGWAAEPKGYWSENITKFLQIMNFRNEIRRSLEENR